jgi:hypothetical protein
MFAQQMRVTVSRLGDCLLVGQVGRSREPVAQPFDRRFAGNRSSPSRSRG